MCRKQRLAAMCMIIIIATGCGDQRVLEKLGFTQSISYDLASDDEHTNDAEHSTDNKSRTKLLIGNTIPRPNSDGGKRSREFISSTAISSKEGKIKNSKQTELMLVSGQLRNTLFGMSLAKQGIWEHIDTLLRDTSISPQVKVTVVNGRAHDLLAKDYPQHPRTGQYLDRMLEKEARDQTIPQTTLYRFTKDYLDDGIDPVAPLVKISDDHIVVDGIALFRDDRYVTKVEPDQSLIFAFIRGNFKNGEMSIDLSEVGRKNEVIMFTSITSQRKVKMQSNPGSNQYRATIHIKATGSILEYTGVLDLDKKEDRMKIEKLINEYVKLKTEDMIAMMQKNKVDSIGLGKYVRNHLGYEQWRKLNWEEVYQNIEVTCDVTTRIKDYGKFLNVNQ